MRNVNYVNMAFIMEKVREEEFPNINMKEMQIKEWVFTALRLLGSALVYEATTIQLDLDTENKRVRMPDGLNYIITIKDENLHDMTEIKYSFNDQVSNSPAYFIKGRFIYVNTTTKKLNVEALQIPADDDGNPLIIDNEYVISAVLAYVMHRITKRLWMTKRLSDSKFVYFEQEWLFYAQAAGASLDTPSFDELRDWDTLNIGFPLAKLTKNNMGDNSSRYVSPTTSSQ